MHDLHQLLRVTLASVRDAVVATDEAAQIILFNPAAEALTGWTEGEAVGRPIEQVLELRESGSDSPIPNPAKAVIRHGASVGESAPILLIGKSGRRIAIEISAYPLRDSADNVESDIKGCVLAFYDVSEALHLADRMAYLAQHDAITGLPNRILLVDRLEQAARISDRHNNQLAVIFVDLNRFNEFHTFKELRDSIGAALADDLLVEVAYRFTQALRESDTVCRLSGNEFVVLLPGIMSPADAESLATKLQAELARPYVLGETTVSASSCIGISIYPKDASDVVSLMRLADEAMSQARLGGENQYRFAGQVAEQPAGTAIAASEVPASQA